MKAGFLGRALEIAKLARLGHKLRRATEESVLQNARIHLVERMGKLRGLPQKMGQILSMSADEEVANDFRPLTDAAQALPTETILAVLEDAWGFPPRTVIEDLEPEGHAASLGQVHRARLRDGDEVAIKVRYPGIREAIKTDLKLLGWLSTPVGGLKRGFKIDDYRQVILEDLEAELDYRQEAHRQRRYAQLAKALDFLVVPALYTSLCRENVLVTKWEDGLTIEEICQSWTEKQKRETATLLLRHFTEMLFGQELLHADPHPGNYRFRRDGARVQVVLYDFGCVYESKDNQSLYLLKLIAACAAGGGEDPYRLLLALGFDETYLEPVHAKLPALCQVLFEPFVRDYPFVPQEWNRSEKVADILGEHRWNFRLAAPANLIFLMRAFSGLDYYVRKLDARVIWKRSLEVVLRRREADLARLPPLPEAKGLPAPFSDMAKHLCVLVERDGKTIGRFSFPWYCVDTLRDLMDDDVLEKIERRGIRLDTICRQARANGYKPVTLFTLEDEGKRLSVWLE